MRRLAITLGAVVCARSAGAGAQTPPVPCPAGAVLVPRATVHIGHGVQPPWADHIESIAAFCIDRDEFTVVRYRQCAAAGSCFPSIWCGQDQANPALACVTAIEAESHCRAYGGSLPTESQWEYAARGLDGRPYPWGQAAPTWQSLPLSLAAGADGATVMAESERTPFGLRHMLDGLAEWTSTTAASPLDVPHRIVKGTHDFVRPLWEHGTIDERSRSPTVGFRCVYRVGTKTITY